MKTQNTSQKNDSNLPEITPPVLCIDDAMEKPSGPKPRCLATLPMNIDELITYFNKQGISV